MSQTPTLQEIQAALAANKESPRETTVASSGSIIYPFWKMEIGQSATVRLLPNGDEESPLPFVEQRLVELIFAGTNTGEMETVKVTVPSLTMFGERDPIVEATRPYWKTNIALARHFHYRRTFLYNSLIVASDFVEEGREPSIRVQRFSKPMHEGIVSFIVELEEGEASPLDYDGGVDYKIKKSQQGEFAAYDGTFARKARKLTAAERELIDAGLPKLSEQIPEKQSAETLSELFRASMAGEPFDRASFPSLYYREAPNAVLASDLAAKAVA